MDHNKQISISLLIIQIAIVILAARAAYAATNHMFFAVFTTIMTMITIMTLNASFQNFQETRRLKHKLVEITHMLMAADVLIAAEKGTDQETLSDIHDKIHNPDEDINPLQQEKSTANTDST